MYTALFASAALVGVVIGLVGLGGGVLIVPLLLHFGFSFPETVAITLFINAVPNTLPGLWFYYKQGHIRWKPALLVTAATVVGITAGSYVGARRMLPQLALYRIYTAFVFTIGFYMLVNYC